METGEKLLYYTALYLGLVKLILHLSAAVHRQ